MTVTFFGHRDTPERVKKPLEKIIKMLIEDYGADRFYVGSQGDFDETVREILGKMKKKHRIYYAVVSAYSQSEKAERDILFPEELRGINPKCAIPRRNEWLINNADIVVTYVHRAEGGAYKGKSLAERKGKTVINIPKIK